MKGVDRPKGHRWAAARMRPSRPRLRPTQCCPPLLASVWACKYYHSAQTNLFNVIKCMASAGKIVKNGGGAWRGSAVSQRGPCWRGGCWYICVGVGAWSTGVKAVATSNQTMRCSGANIRAQGAPMDGQWNAMKGGHGVLWRAMLLGIYVCDEEQWHLSLMCSEIV